MNNVDLLKQIRRILVLAKTSANYSKDPFDQERLAEIVKIATDILTDGVPEHEQALQAGFTEDAGYITPKVDVRILIKNEAGEILFVQDRRTGEWSLPGGFAEIGASPVENALRETYEETGLTVQIERLLGIFDTDKRRDIPQLAQYYKIFFVAKIQSGSFKKNIETKQAKYFSIDDLPELSKQRTTREQLIKLESLDKGSVFIE